MRTGPHVRRRAAAAVDDRPLRRFRPPRGALLTMEAVRGPWRPSGAVAGAGFFAIVWEGRHVRWFAALHDFCPDAQAHLIAACRWADRHAGFDGAWPDGRSAG
jgi:hypothetical protein